MLKSEINTNTADKRDLVTFIVEGQQLICKKSCLVKYDYFKKLLEGSFKEAEQSEIEIHDVPFDAFKQITDYIHGTPIKFTEQNTYALLSLAQQFLIEPLQKYFIDLFTKSPSKEYLVEALEFFPKELGDIAIKFISDNSSYPLNLNYHYFCFSALRKHCFSAFERLFSESVKKPSYNVVNTESDGRRLLDLAIEMENKSIVKLLLINGANLLYQFRLKDDYYTPLLMAFDKHDTPMVDLLLEHDADPTRAYEGRSPSSDTYYHIAAKLGFLEIMQCFLNRDKKSKKALAICDSNGKCPLHIAIENGHSEIVKLLFLKDFSVTDLNNRNALHYLAIAKNGEKLLSIFQGYKLKPLFQKDKQQQNDRWSTTPIKSGGRLPIHEAMEQGGWEVTKFFIDMGALDNFACKEDFFDANKKTPFDLASDRGQQDFVIKAIKYLLDTRASNNSALSNELLFWAAQREYYEIVNYLVVEKKADVNYRSSTDDSFLHWAATKGRLEAVIFLLKYGAKINHQNQNQCTALHNAAKQGHSKVVKHLLTNGANATFWDKQGKTAYHLADEQLQLQKGTLKAEQYQETVDALESIACKIQ